MMKPFRGAGSSVHPSPAAASSRHPDDFPASSSEVSCRQVRPGPASDAAVASGVLAEGVTCSWLDLTMGPLRLSRAEKYPGRSAPQLGCEPSHRWT